VTKSGYIAIEEIDTRAEQIITYRAPTDTDAEYVFLYVENGRLFSTDGNLNWRIQIWQDVLKDLSNEGQILTGYGYESKIPAMEPLYRSGVDGTNENVHNFLINIIARGGIVHLLMYLTFFTLLMINIARLKRSLDILNLALPIFITSLFDASMENSHFSLIFFITLGLFVQKLDSIKDSY
jgi:O-antigen ligase